MDKSAHSTGLRSQIISHVVGRIMNGEWKPGDRIPSEHALTVMLSVSRMTAHHALLDLARQTMFSRLMLVRPHREGSEALRAITGSPREVELLGVDTGTPLLEVVRRTWSPEGVVTIARMLRAGNGARLAGRIRSLSA